MSSDSMGPPPVPNPTSPSSSTSPSHLNRPLSPLSPQTPPIAMIPRSRASRRNSQTTSTHPHPSPAISGRSTPAATAPTAAPLTSTTYNTSASNSTSSSQPVRTPLSPPLAPGPLISGSRSGSGSGSHSAGHPLQKAKNGSAVAIGQSNNNSSVSINALNHGGHSHPATTLGGVVSTPQTGASKMAAAAKRGQAGYDGLPVNGQAVGMEEEDHPLSDKSLKDRGYQTLHTLNRLFHLPERWNLIRPLGQGAYGLVISVQDSVTSEPVAVKCITKVFDKVILARRALREITLLRHFNGHENLTGLIDLDHVWDGYNEIYMYMEPMEADLHQIVRSGQPLSNSHIQFFTYQLLRGMKYIHSANVIHRDLKPGNLLVNADCELKICDFGLARGFQPVTGEPGQQEELKLTEYVATRWYRAPEVMLSNRRYTTAIDVWSIGCILAELLGGKPIFKGKDYVDQINLILGVLGTPDDETLDRVASDKAAGYIRTLPHSETVPLQLILPDADPQALDLLSFLLVFDASKRIDVPTALTHAYVSAYHDPSDEPDCPELFSKWEEVESLQTIPQLKAAITREIKEYREEVRNFDEEEDFLSEIDEEGQVVLVNENITASPLSAHDKVVGGAEPGPSSLSPVNANRRYYDEIGVSPLSSTVPLPRPALAAAADGTSATANASPLSARVPLARITSRDRPRSKEREGREASPHTPATALTPMSEDSFSAPMTGRSSRRSSGHSFFARRPTSFLFSNPLGAGMTPMSVPSNPTALANALSNAGVGAPPGVTPGGGIGGVMRSRAPSSTGDFASLKPLIRQLSSMTLDQMGRESGTESERSPEVPPMAVSPSDAPPSELPRPFSHDGLKKESQE